MWTMLLKMSAAVLLFGLATAGLWLFCGKQRPRTVGRKALVGLAFGTCCVAANHLGVDENLILLNVRDLGPWPRACSSARSAGSSWASSGVRIAF